MPQQGSYTYTDLLAFPEDNIRREIIDGELIVSPSPIVKHQVVSGRLHLLFGNHVAAHGGARVFYAPLDVVLSDRNVVQPDLFVVLEDRTSAVGERNVRGAPSLVIEIVSPGSPRMDRVRKRDLYASFGVPEYWIVDPESDRVEVYRIDTGVYGKPEIFEPGDGLTYDGLPGLRIDVAALFAD